MNVVGSANWNAYNPLVMTRLCIIGPTYPYRGGIAHYTTLLTRHLREEEGNEVLLISFSRQYPKWLFPGKSDKDPSKRPLTTEAEYLLDPINPVTWRRTLKRVAKFCPDVVLIPWWHPYFAPSWGILSRAIQRLPNNPKLIFICHNVLPHEQGKMGKFMLPKITKWTLQKGDKFVVHATSDRETLRGILPEAKIEVKSLPMIMDETDTSDVELPVKLPDDRPILLFCGIVRPYKGLDVLLDAFALAIEERPLHLVVAGEFWKNSRPQYEEQITRLGIAEHITIVDEYLPDEVFTAFIDRADVVVLPYKSATQSGVIQAAFGRNTPVITTDVGGLAEVVENGRNGFVVEPNNNEMLLSALLSYFDNDKNLDRDRSRTIIQSMKLRNFKSTTLYSSDM